MHPEIKEQKKILLSAIALIEQAENCETAIRSGHPDVDWWEKQKTVCAEKYAEHMEKLLSKYVDISDYIN